jgi:hypothetical protein
MTARCYADGAASQAMMAHSRTNTTSAEDYLADAADGRLNGMTGGTVRALVSTATPA